MVGRRGRKPRKSGRKPQNLHHVFRIRGSVADWIGRISKTWHFRRWPFQGLPPNRGISIGKHARCASPTQPHGKRSGKIDGGHKLRFATGGGCSLPRTTLKGNSPVIWLKT